MTPAQFALSPYPGRGVVVGAGTDGRPYWVYFVTGRSDASRRRRLRVGGSAVTVEPIDDDAGPDDLRHYACVRVTARFVVVGNGAHVSSIADRLERGDAFAAAYRDLVPEPDPPIFTPRIAVAHGTCGTWLGTVGRQGADDRRDTRRVDIQPGAGYLLSTYDGDGVAVHAARELRELSGLASAGETVDALWAALDPRYRVVVAGGYFDRAPVIEATVRFDDSHGDAAGDGGRER